MTRKSKAGYVAILLAVIALSAAGGYWYWSANRPDGKTKTANRGPAKPGKTAAQTTATEPVKTTAPPGTYSNSRYGFAATSPDQWTVVQSQNGDGAMYTAPDNQATIRVYGFRNTDLKSQDALYEAELSARQTAASGFQVESKSEVVIDGRPAIDAVWAYIDVSGIAVKERLVLTTKRESGTILEYKTQALLFTQYEPVFIGVLNSLKMQ